MASVEAAITQSEATEEDATKARVGVISALGRARLLPKNVQPEEAKAVKELAKDDDIVILPADKGKATVVMNRSDYSTKMLAMLGDEDTYQLMAKDPTASLESNMNKVLLNLRRAGHLTKSTTVFAVQLSEFHASMGCPKSISPMSLSAQSCPLCPRPRMPSPNSLPPCCHPLLASRTPM